MGEEEKKEENGGGAEGEEKDQKKEKRDDKMADKHSTNLCYHRWNSSSPSCSDHHENIAIFINYYRW